MIAAPIRSQGVVIGLIEVFSPYPEIFQPDHELALQHLTVVVSAAVLRANLPESASPALSAASVDDEFPVETPADLPILQLSPSRNVLLASLAMALLALLWASQPWVKQRWMMQYWSKISRSDLGSAALPQAAAPPAASASKLEALRQLAAGGDPVAQFDIGERYWTGDQVPQDYAQAVRWFSLAAEQDNVAAQAMLGDCYWAGRGVPSDPMRAYFWSFLAQAGGDETSKSRVALIASRLTASQIGMVQKEVKDWMARHPGKVSSGVP
jgi:TPR repeat protein